LQVLGQLVDEWKKMTKSDAAPILATTVVHKDYSRREPDAVVKFVRAMIETARFGRTETEQAAAMLRQASNLDAKDATSYARLWSDIYFATMEPADVATFKTMAEIFRVSGTIEGRVPDSLFATGPYEKAKRQP
jgi:NitT/TauT family transport system substrate-binding protein